MKKKIIFSSILLVILALWLGVRQYYLKEYSTIHKSFFNSNKNKSKISAHSTDAFLSLKPFIVNLNSNDTTPHFISLSIDLQLKDKNHIPIINSKMFIIRDVIEAYLRKFSYKDLQGDAGIDRLRQGIISKIDEIIDPYHVKDLLFQNLLVQ
jgi:flagellar basal body-associated protein FliL